MPRTTSISRSQSYNISTLGNAAVYYLIIGYKSLLVDTVAVILSIKLRNNKQWTLQIRTCLLLCGIVFFSILGQIFKKKAFCVRWTERVLQGHSRSKVCNIKVKHWFFNKQPKLIAVWTKKRTIHIFFVVFFLLMW